MGGDAGNGAPRAPARDADRERVLGVLREHYAIGNLDDAELDRRTGIVLSARYTDEVAAAVTDLPQLVGRGIRPPGDTGLGGRLGRPPRTPRGSGAGGRPPGTSGGTGARDRSRGAARGRHAQSDQPGPGWVPTSERFRDPSSAVIMRVWIDPADDSRHYVPESPPP